jgi:hypothetical protein
MPDPGMPPRMAPISRLPPDFHARQLELFAECSDARRCAEDAIRRFEDALRDAREALRCARGDQPARPPAP